MNVDELLTEPRWYKTNLRALSWGEIRRSFPDLPNAVLSFVLCRLGIFVVPTLDMVTCMPEKLGSLCAEQGTLSVEAQLSLKPIVGALVYESGFRVAAWQKLTEQVIAPKQIDNGGVCLLHESGDFMASANYIRMRFSKFKTEGNEMIETEEIAEEKATAVFTQLQSGKRFAVSNFSKHYDPVNCVVYVDANLQPVQMLPLLQRKIAKYIRKGDIPIKVTNFDTLCTMMDAHSLECHKARLRRGLFVPATDTEIASLRAQIYDRESQER